MVARHHGWTLACTEHNIFDDDGGGVISLSYRYRCFQLSAEVLLGVSKVYQEYTFYCD